MRSKRILFGYGLIVAVTWPQLAHAYIDPGTGSMILQALLGAIGAGYLFFKTSWHKVSVFFKGEKTDGQAGRGPQDSTSDSGDLGSNRSE